MSEGLELREQYKVSADDRLVDEYLELGKTYKNLGTYAAHLIVIGKTVKHYYMFEADDETKRYTAREIRNVLGI